MLPKQACQTYRLRAVSLFFYCSQFTTNGDQFRVNTQYLWSYLVKQNGHKDSEQSPVAWDANNERRIINNCQKSSTDSFYQSFSSLFTNQLEVHSRRFMCLRKRRSCKYRHCRCLARIAIALNRRSVFGQIQHTKPPQHLCLLNKLLQLVPVRVLTSSCYMIGVIFIFQSLCQ